MTLKRVCSLITVAMSSPCLAQSGIYVEYYDNLAPFDVAPDGWRTVPGFPCRHGPDANNDGIPDNGLGTPEPGLSSGSNIFLSNVNSVNYRVFAVSPSNTDIGAISVSGSSTVPVLFVGRPAGFPNPSQFARLPVAGCRNLGSISYGAPKLVVQAYIEGTLTGSASVHNLVRFDLGTATSGGGTVSGTITHNPSADGTVPESGGVFARQVSSTGVIRSYTSDIRVVQTYVDFEGSLQTFNGADVLSFLVDRDFIEGTVSVAGSLPALTINRHGSGLIDVDGNLGTGSVSGSWGAFPVGATPNYSSSDIIIGGSITNSLSVAGEYVGTLRAGSANTVSIGGAFYDYSGSIIDGLIDIDGSIDQLSIGTPVAGSATGTRVDFSANSVVDSVFFDGDYESGDFLLRDGLPASAIVKIGGDLAAAASIELENNSSDPNDVGLTGQVVINSNDNMASWFGDVIVGTTTLAPGYTQLSGELGGGAAGRRGFNFHQRTSGPPSGVDRDCDPYHTENLSLAPTDVLNSVTISHYGPVFVQGAEPRFKVEFRPDYFSGGGPQWEDRSALFEVDETQSGTSDETALRTIVIKAKSSNMTGFKAAGRWRIRPYADKVVCAEVDNEPDVEYDSSVVSGDLGSSSGTQYSWYAFRTRLQAPGGSFPAPEQ